MIADRDTDRGLFGLEGLPRGDRSKSWEKPRGTVDPPLGLRALVRHLEFMGYVRSDPVREAFLRADRAAFLAPGVASQAYSDRPVAIGFDQTISAPHMVAIMLEALRLSPGQRVLEVGGGSGYHAALAAELVRPGGRVRSVELVPELAVRARQTLLRQGYGSLVEVVEGDGSVGDPSGAPYDRIFVACAAPAIPQPLVDQLANDGILLIPVGSRLEQRLLRVQRDPRLPGGHSDEDLGGCVFVPLRGKLGFE